MSIVARQPHSAGELRRAAMALVACPTSSIGSVHKQDVRAASRAFPERITEGVYYCGYAAESSFGASSWLIVRPQGNVLVDSPRAAGPLLDNIDALGGVRTILLTHRDDVADHEKLARRFGCERVLHAADQTHDTRAVERALTGTEPIALADDLLVIPVPGHTRGSVALLWNQVLLTGDHLWGSESGERLHASRGVCWHSWPEQTRSMERLLAHDFTWVLPGHGATFHRDTPEAMRAALGALLIQMKARG